MAGQEQVRKTSPKADEVEVEDVTVDTKKGDDLKAEIDDLLDEIDDVLETNAEDFVRAFVQKGGQ